MCALYHNKKLLPCDVATGVCHTLLFLLRVCDGVKVTSPLLSHHD